MALGVSSYLGSCNLLVVIINAREAIGLVKLVVGVIRLTSVPSKTTDDVFGMHLSALLIKFTLKVGTFANRLELFLLAVEDTIGAVTFFLL